jgi:hypothetical protein
MQDADFMYNQINDHPKIKLNSKKIGKGLLDANVFSKYRRGNNNDTYDFFSFLKSRYNAESYVIFTNALFSLDKSKCLIGFKEYDKLGAKGEIYLLYLVDGCWQVYKKLEELDY